MTIYIGSGQTTMIVAKTAGEMLLIETGVTVEVEGLACDAGGDAIYRSFLIRGTLASTAGTAFEFGQTPSINSHAWMKVDDAAVVRTSGNGLVIKGGGFSLENVGKILTGGVGVTVSGQDCVVTNNDTMASWGGRLFEVTGSNAIITNNVEMSARSEVISSSGAGLIVTNNKSMSGQAGVVSASGNKAIVTNNGTMSAMGHGVSIAGDNAIVTNTGTIKSGAGYGVFMGGAGGVVTNHSTISGTAAGLADIGSGTEITNYADISGVMVGIMLDGRDAVLVNHANVTGGRALSVTGIGNEIENNKTIAGTSQSQSAVMLGGTGTVLTNNGAITSASGLAISGDAGDVTLINRGTITGSIDLGDGSDTIDTMGGKVSGTVSGGLGDDIYILDRAIKLVETEGGGIDTIRATYSAKLATHVENLVLIGKGQTTGTGNGLDNEITGNKAANVLKGGDGDDTLNGGRGNDRLTGDDGKDLFVFLDRCGTDVISDFDDGNDLISFAGMSGVSGFRDIEAAASQDGADVLIDFGRAGSIRLEGVSLTDLDADDFLF